jgi:DNA-binding response OmpR family regulator
MHQVETRWRELCMEAVNEYRPERRMAIVGELASILRNDIHDFGHVQVDVTRSRVQRDGQLVSLTSLEFHLLRHFIERAGTPISREELLRSVWGYEAGAFTRTVDIHVHGLRQKLEQDARRPELIVTVPGVGYKFMGFQNCGLAH